VGVAYFIEFDNEDLQVDYTDGKSVGKAMDDLNTLAQGLGLPSLEQFMGQSTDDIGDMLGKDIEMEDGSDGAASWFEPKEGIAVLERLIAELQTNPKRLKSAAAVVEDLESYVAALRVAQQHGAKWHLSIDF
jgi:hypothetical protein